MDAVTISLLVGLGCFTIPPAVSSVKKTKLPRLPFRKELKEGELLPGVTKPTTILANMIVAELLQRTDTDNSERIVLKSGVFAWRYSSYDNSLQFEAGGFGVDFDKYEKSLLREGLLKYIHLRNQRRAAELAEKNQQKALDIIEKVFQPKEKAYEKDVSSEILTSIRK